MIDKALHLLYKRKLTLCEYRQIEDICEGTANTTISQAVADFFTKNKVTVKPEGIGWKIKI